MLWLVEKRSPMPSDNNFKYEVVFYLEHPNRSFLLKIYSGTGKRLSKIFSILFATRFMCILKTYWKKKKKKKL